MTGRAIRAAAGLGRGPGTVPAASDAAASLPVMFVREAWPPETAADLDAGSVSEGVSGTFIIESS